MSLRLRSAILILLIVALDRASKLYIRGRISLWDMIPVIPGFLNIVHAENAGAAFSILADAPHYWRVILLIGVSLVVMAVIGFMLWRLPKHASLITATALAMIFAGAAGNLWDRVIRGTVTDFIQVFLGAYEFPAFNVADSAITVGAALLIIDLWRGQKSA